MADWEVDYSYNVREGGSLVLTDVLEENVEETARDRVYEENNDITGVEIDGIRKIKD